MMSNSADGTSSTKRRALNKAVDWLSDYLDWVGAAVLSVLVGVLAILGVAAVKTAVSATLFVLGVLSFSALRDRKVSRRLLQEVSDLRARSDAIFRSDELLLDRMRVGITRVFPHTVGFDWVSHVKDAHEVVIVGIRLSFLDQPAYRRAFETLLRGGGSATLVLGDPRSPMMWLRYLDEPHPWDSRSGHELSEVTEGLESLALALRSLHDWKEGLIHRGLDVTKLDLRVFNSYPTHAFFKFDQDLFAYHYPYLERGIYAPAFLFTDAEAEPYKILAQSLDAVLGSAMPLEAMVEDIMEWYRRGALSDRVVRTARLAVETL
jgi:hypothetical protein